MGIVYLAAGAVLAGWVLNLWRSLADRSVAHHLPAVKGAVGALLVILLLLLAVTGELSARGHSRATVLKAMMLVAFVVASVTTEWFLIIPGSVSDVADVVVAVVVALAAAAAVLLTRSRRDPAVRRGGLAAAVVVLAVSVVAMVVSSAPTVIGTQQRLVWVGLDVAELVAVVIIGVLLLRRRSVVVPAGAVLALFACDATINIGVAGGHDLLLALAMAGVEVPAALLSGVIGYRSDRVGAARVA